MAFSSPNRRHPTPPLTATRDTPWLGVHVITEFMFCPRAGLIAFEKGQEDDDDDIYDELQPNLQYLPCYDLSQIEVALNRALDDLKIVLQRSLALGGITLLMALIGLVFNAQLLLIAGIAAIVLTIIVTPQIIPLRLRIKTLQQRRLLALNAQARQPNPEVTNNDVVNWWELLAAGFESRSYREPLRDPELRVAGKPWRVLRKGSLRIPVWRRRGGRTAERKLRGQHYARMAAYCHLIEKAEGAQSPYGIVLFGANSYEGMTVSNSRSNGRRSRNAFHKGLREARSVIAAHRNGHEPLPPQPSQCCWNCPSGKPFAYRPGISDSKPRRLNSPPHPRHSQLDGRSYHSECGDRFRWLPPHAKASDKHLA